jgi:hypothetical protein
MDCDENIENVGRKALLWQFTSPLADVRKKALIENDLF